MTHKRFLMVALLMAVLALPASPAHAAEADDEAGEDVSSRVTDETKAASEAANSAETQKAVSAEAAKQLKESSLTYVPGAPEYVPAAKCTYVKAGKPFEAQLDVFTEEGVYTFCNNVEAADTPTPYLSPVYRFRSFVSWVDHSCAVEGVMQIPASYRSRCIMRNYFVDKDFYCKRPGDKDGDGLVDGVKNVPIGLAEVLGAFVVSSGSSGSGGTLVMRKGADIDTTVPAPQYWSDIGNVIVPYAIANSNLLVARSYAFPRPYAKTDEEKKQHLQIVVQNRRSDLLRGTYFSPDLLKSAGSPVEVGECDK